MSRLRKTGFGEGKSRLRDCTAEKKKTGRLWGEKTVWEDDQGGICKKKGLRGEAEKKKKKKGEKDVWSPQKYYKAGQEPTMKWEGNDEGIQGKERKKEGRKAGSLH